MAVTRARCTGCGRASRLLAGSWGQGSAATRVLEERLPSCFSGCPAGLDHKERACQPRGVWLCSKDAGCPPGSCVAEGVCWRTPDTPLPAEQAARASRRSRATGCTHRLGGRCQRPHPSPGHPASDPSPVPAGGGPPCRPRPSRGGSTQLTGTLPACARPALTATRGERTCIVTGQRLRGLGTETRCRPVATPRAGAGALCLGCPLPRACACPVSCPAVHPEETAIIRVVGETPRNHSPSWRERRPGESMAQKEETNRQRDAASTVGTERHLRPPQEPRLLWALHRPSHTRSRNTQQLIHHNNARETTILNI